MNRNLPQMRAGRSPAEIQAKCGPVSGVRDESPIDLNDIVKAVPALLTLAQGRTLTRDAIKKWVSRGRVTASGARVYLDAQKIGTRWFSSREAAERFAESLRS